MSSINNNHNNNAGQNAPGPQTHPAHIAGNAQMVQPFDNSVPPPAILHQHQVAGVVPNLGNITWPLPDPAPPGLSQDQAGRWDEYQNEAAMVDAIQFPRGGGRVIRRDVFVFYQYHFAGRARSFGGVYPSYQNPFSLFDLRSRRRALIRALNLNHYIEPADDTPQIPPTQKRDDEDDDEEDGAGGYGGMMQAGGSGGGPAPAAVMVST